MDDRPDQVGGWKNWAFLACLLIQPVLAVGEEQDADRLALHFLMNKTEAAEVIQDTRQQFVRTASRAGVTRKDRACFMELAQDLGMFLLDFRMATDDLDYRTLAGLVEDDPDEARPIVDELMQLRATFSEKLATSAARARGECMSFED